MSKEEIGYSNAVKLVKTRSKGRCVEANRLIRPGELIIKEAPFACLPLSTSTMSKVSLRHGQYKTDQVELSLIQTAQRRKTKVDSVILASRCLENEHTARRKGHQNTFRLWNSLNCCNYLHNDDELSAAADMVLRLCTLKSVPTTHDECKHALCKLSNNAFTVTDHTFAECGRAIFLSTACINHSCEPNSLHHYDEQGNIIVRAARAIHPGEEVTISYIDIGKPTWWRQAQLDKYGFRCTCHRCVSVELFEKYRCQTSNCKDYISLFPKWAKSDISKYHSWLQGTVPVKPLTGKSNLNDDFIIPCQPLLTQLSCAPKLVCVEPCHCCGRSLEHSLLCSTIDKAQKHFAQGSFIQCWKIISQWFIPGHHLYQYCLAQLCSKMEEEIAINIRSNRALNNDTVTQYLKLLPTAIKSRSLCYHQLHPSIIMQQVYTINFVVSIITYQEQSSYPRQQAVEEGLRNFAKLMMQNRVSTLEGLRRYVGERGTLFQECVINIEEMQRFMSL